MKYKILLSLVAIVSFSQALELRISKGTFNWQMGMPFMKADFDLDTNIYSLSEQHNNFGDSNLYYFYNADIYKSDTMDKITTFVTKPLTQEVPFFGSFNDAVEKYTSIPVPAEYKIRGFDLNLGIGYDLIHTTQGIVGIGVNTGLSLPVMKMTNMKSSAKLTYSLLKNTETTIKTYKLGPIIHANYEIAPNFLIYGSLSTGFQTGTIENDWVKSSFDVDGSYTTLDLGLRYTPYSSTKDLGWIRLDPKLFITAGYSYKKWSMDDEKLNAFNIAEFSSGGLFTSSFDLSYLYIGLGYDF